MGLLSGQLLLALVAENCTVKRDVSGGMNVLRSDIAGIEIITRLDSIDQRNCGSKSQPDAKQHLAQSPVPYSRMIF